MFLRGTNSVDLQGVVKVLHGVLMHKLVYDVTGIIYELGIITVSILPYGFYVYNAHC